MNKKNEANLSVKINYDPRTLKNCKASVEAEGSGDGLLNCLSIAVSALAQCGITKDLVLEAVLHGFDTANKMED